MGISSWRLGDTKVEFESIELQDGVILIRGSVTLTEESLNEFFKSVPGLPVRLRLSVGKDGCSLRVARDFLNGTVSFTIVPWERGIALEIHEAEAFGFIPLRGAMLDAIETVIFKYVKIPGVKRENSRYLFDLASLLPRSIRTRVSGVTALDGRIVFTFA